ncbi:hypothetical protein ASJ81_17105 [Methanosarcina spelaei]|uniref:HTH tetR-type domain-containing protein n=1 Tax=Methanosarcina spelaei TaxID=1036679 RepID=A0A2A2HWD3_9EURY|nr:TetR/AcrR family transcriptional regulator [Methanosarcina spelaei]PAV13605.1 hypothetical protein ASJ81_17105 [Methanosarcina spelaei]
MAVTDRQRRKKEKRRNEIIDAAERLFYARGFDKVSMDEIAQEVELSKGALYFYFKSKDSLFCVIVARKWMEFGEILKENISHGKTGLEKINILIRWYIQFARENAAYNDMATTFGPQLYQRMDAEDSRMLAEVSTKYIPSASIAVREGIEDGSIRNDLDAVLLGMYIQIITLNVASPDPSIKNLFALHGIDYDIYTEMLPTFLCPSIAHCPEKECSDQDGSLQQ